MIFFRYVGFLMLIVLTMASSAGAEEMLRYAGATTLQRFFMPEMSRAFSGETAIKVHIEGGNTGPGIKALLAGEIDIAGAGRLLTAEEKSQGLVEHFLGWDALAVIVHEQNPLENLTMEQLQGIYSGKIRNWNEVGGQTGPIVVVTCSKGSGMRNAVKDLILVDEEYLSQEIVSAIVAEADQQVSLFPVGITVLSRSMVDAEHVKSIKVNGVVSTAENIAEGHYLLVKPLTLVTKGQPRGDLARFIAMVKSPQGKALLQKNFVPVE